MHQLTLTLTRVLIALLLTSFGVHSQELITTVRYELDSLTEDDAIYLRDPLYYEEFQNEELYKIDRRFRIEANYNRKHHSDSIGALEWRLTFRFENTTTLESKTLVLESTLTDGTYLAWADFLGNDSYMEWELDTLYGEKYSSGWTSASLSELPTNDIHVEFLVFNDRIVSLDESSCANMSLTGDTLNWQFVRGAVEYDVEWVFIDSLDQFTYSGSSPEGPFEFREPVRITTFKHNHRMDLIYPKGTVYFRIRPKGYFFSETSDREVYYAGAWCYSKKTGGTMLYAIGTHYEGLKNWQYTVGYAENGMSKSTIAYMDGSLRGRQQLSRMNSTGIVVAAGSVYDYEGRQAVQIIPTPVSSGSLDYYVDLHEDNLGGVFDKEDFDEGTSDPMGTGAGAGRYYSSSNDFTTAQEPFRNRIPDAEGYPYVQTKFINDNTGRVRTAAGAGYTHRMGGGHESHFFYVKPTERDLRELFGSNVGDLTHYDKQIAVDPNGQASVTYTDQLGRTIAAGLYGEAPDNLLELDNNPGGTMTEVTSTLMPSNMIITDDYGNLKSVTDYFHMNIGTNDITLDYDILSASINGDTTIFGSGCVSCFYELNITVYDPSGDTVDLSYPSQTDSQTYPTIYEKYSGASLNCDSTWYNPTILPISKTLSISMTGEYRIHKVLKVDMDSVASYISNNATSLSTAPDSASLASTYLSNIVTTGCGFDCDAFYTQECREELGYPASGTLSTNAQDSVDVCIAEKCALADSVALADQDSIGNRCNMLLGVLKSDVSPGGWVFEDDLLWQSISSNWDFTFNTYAGGSFNPTSLDDLEDNWEYDMGWADSLVESHPEYCHYQKCLSLDTLMMFMDTLYAIETWADAESEGYLNSSTHDFEQNGDPLYSHSIYSSTAGTWLSNLNSNYQSTSDNIHAYVTGDLFTNYSELSEDGNGNALTGDSLDNRIWELMRGIFIGERYNYIEEEYNNQVSCVYYDSPNANFFDAAELENAPISMPSYFSPINGSCPEVCNMNTQYWMQRLAEECPDLTEAQLDSISGYLQNYCLNDCDGIYNLAGSIQLSDLLAPDPYLDSAATILNTVCSLSLEFLAEVDTCSSYITDTTYNLYGYSLTMQKNLAALTTIAYDQYNLFINSPAITAIAGYTTKFSENHYDATMDLKLTDVGASTNSIFGIDTISSVSIIADTTDFTYGTILFDVRVSFIDGTDSICKMDQFSLLQSDRTTWSTFSVGTIDLKYSVIGSKCDSVMNPFYIAFDLESWIDDCIDDIEEEALILAQLDYENQLADLTSELYGSFSSSCFGDDLDETFSIRYNKQEYAFTLYYYDQAGNLVQTVPPQGVHITTDFNGAGEWQGTEPDHDMKTMYTYNSLNQMTKSQTPDGGKANFYYNSVQQLRFSQNDYQVTLDHYSYTRYDELGRPIEVGVTEIASFEGYYNSYKDSNDYPAASAMDPTLEVVRSYYEQQPLTLDVTLGWDPKDLNTRIAAVAYYEEYDGDQDDYSSASYYDYDIHGNIQKILNDHPLMGSKQRYKTMEYDYDLYSGKMKKVCYQCNQQDQFMHRYSYDDDNRIVTVETSRDGIKWANDAEYFYFLTGGMARTELGDLKVQGMDYAMNIQGWLKGMNSNTLEARRDMGADGAVIDSENKWVARDAAGFSLSYHTSDYTPIVAQTVTDNKWFAESESSFMPGTGADLYNGNIRSMISAISKTNNETLDIHAKVYQYDQLNRIKEAKTFDATNLIANNSWSGGSFTNAYYSSYEFDLNGNLTELTRNGSGEPGAVEMDNFTYYYQDGASGSTTAPTVLNRLFSVTDSVSSDPYSADIDATQSSGTANYTYDEIGRLTADADEGIDTIFWTTTNKVSYIKRSSSSSASDLAFKYDPMGNRIAKIEYPKSTPGSIDTSGIIYTYYIHDATGNVMATYQQESLTPTYTTLVDYELYGAKRLGVLQVSDSLNTTANFDYCSQDNRASAIIELTSSTFSNGQTVEYKVGDQSLNDPITWGTTLATNVAKLLNAINDSTATTSLEASVWHSKNNANIYYLELKYTQPGNWNGGELDLYMNGSISTTFTPKREMGYGSCSGQSVVGYRRFEISNHLGNVLAVITDRKWALDDGVFNHTTGAQTSTTKDDTVDYYLAQVVTYNDYYPYGMLMDGRKGSSAEYRYGFQGFESDDEISGSGNNIAFEFRNYDPRIGRMWSIDPLASKYPFYTPYAFSGNRVIDCREFEGLEPIDAINPKTNEPYFKPVLKLNLPNGDFVTIYGSVHGGPYAVSQEDRNKIHSFTEQGYSFSLKNNFDHTYARDNGTTVNIQAGVGGVSRQNTDENGIPQYATEGLFRVNSIQAPSQITQTVPLNTPGNQQISPGFNYNIDGVPQNINGATTNELQQFAQNQYTPILDQRTNNVLANAPANAVRTIENITVQINSNLSFEQQQSIMNTMQGNSNYQVNFQQADLGNTNTIGQVTVNYTDTTQQQQPTQTLEEF